MQKVYLDGSWVDSRSNGAFQATNPQTGESLATEFPLSSWADCETALVAASRAYQVLRRTDPETIAVFLEHYADAIEAQRDRLARVANQETGLPVNPRLFDVELPRTYGQLRQAAAAARAQDWTLATIDTANNIRAYHASIGPVFVIGPNNFPFAFNGIAGGDFAAAIAAGNPVIAKAHPAHPETSRLLCELAAIAAEATGMPAASVQMIYRTSHEDGLKLIADSRIASVGFTGSRSAGMAIKRTCDAAGKSAYLEMSSVNPVVLLPGAIAEQPEEVANAFCTSCMMGAGQFCTNPGLVIIVQGTNTDTWIADLAKRFSAAPGGTLLTAGVRAALGNSVETLVSAGAKLLAGGRAIDGPRIAYENTLLTLEAKEFLTDPHTFQTEMFGAASLIVRAPDVDQAIEVIDSLEGNLTGTVYHSHQGTDDDAAGKVAMALRPKVGRLLCNKMPTGVAVSPAMNHGGPFPATGHSGFTAVGFPASLRRFSMLQCFDNVDEAHLPPALRNENPTGALWRWIDGEWTQANAVSPHES